VSFTPRPLYLQGKSPQYPLDKRLGGPQSPTKTYWGSGGKTSFLTSALDAGEWSASCPGRFTSKERAPNTHWIRGSVGTRAGLATVSRGKIRSPCKESNPKILIVQPVPQSLYRLSYHGSHQYNYIDKNILLQFHSCLYL
jgi:hypothetical protein